MKNLAILLFLSMFSSCGIAQVEQAPLVRVNAYVQEITGDTAKLQPSTPDITYEVAAGYLVAEKECVFWLEVHETTGRTRKATVVGWAYTTGQVQRDQAATAKELSNRKIIRH